jgi:TonB-linked SusC/RagA family outer membrane protein
MHRITPPSYFRNVIPLFKSLLLLILLTCAAASIVNANTTGEQQPVLEKKITLHARDIPLKECLDKIARAADVPFIYTGNYILTVGKVSLNVKNKKISEVLGNLFRYLPLSYVLVDDQIVIRYDNSKRTTLVVTTPNPEPVAATATQAGLYNFPVHGVVKSAKGELLKGVTILIKGSSIGTSTNEKGEFDLKNVPDNATLIITMVGYKRLEVKAKASLVITLEEAGTLDDVVVTGFQRINRKEFTGAAVTLKADEIKIDGLTDVSRMLEGRAAGVSVQNVSGTFGAAPKIRIRGATSITGENKPLWVIDGVVLEDIVNISNDQLSNGDPSTMLGSAVAGLNVNDIETFDILKDAAAAALYGARAMNGVIVITTKKGKAGKTAFNYTGNFGVQMKPTYANYDIMSSADQMSVYSELERKGMLRYSDLVNARNSGVYGKLARLLQYPNSDSVFEVENTPEARQAWLLRYAGANTDWFDILFRNSLTQEHTLSVSTGNEKSQSYFSTSFYNDNGWTLADNVKRYTVNVRNNYAVSDKLQVGLQVNGSIRQQRAPGTEDRTANPVEGRYSRDFDINPFSYALNTSRVLTAYDQNGDLEYFTRDFTPFNIINEIKSNYLKLNVADFKLQGNLSYKILPTLTYDFVGAMRYAKTTEEHEVLENSNQAGAYRSAATSVIRQANPYLYRDPAAPGVEPFVVLPYGGFYKTRNRQLLNYTFRNMLTFRKSFNDDDHLVTILAGQEIKYADRQLANDVGVGYQYNNGGVPYIDYRFIKKLTEANTDYFGLSKERDRFVAFFANGSYTYKGKYTFSGTVRDDGSNRLGSSPQARWLPTWTLSGAWNVDREKFMENVGMVSHLTLKTSYGLNAYIGDATNTTAILKTQVTNRHYLSDQQTAISIKNLENADLTWEKKYEFNVTADIGLFKERLYVVPEIYSRRSFDLIHLIKTAGIGGETFKTANYADMKSHGIDLTIGGKIISSRNWSWNSSFVFGYNTTLVTNAKNQPMIFDLVKQEGGAKEGYAVRGLFSVSNAGLDPYNGLPLFTSDKGKSDYGVYMQSLNTEYLQYEGSVDPTYTGGLNNTVRFNQFSLNTLVTFQAGNKIRLTPVYNARYTDLTAMPGEFKRRWTLPGDDQITNIPSVAMLSVQNELSNNTQFPYNNYNYSHDRVADGGFIRLKAVSLQYSLPVKMINKIGFKTASLSAVGNNLWLIYSDSRLHGQDPEFFNTGGVAMPITKQVTFSLKLGL